MRQEILPVLLLVLCFLLGSLVGVIVMRTCYDQELPETTKPRVIHHTIPVKYHNKALLLDNFQKDLISMDEVIQILLLDTGQFVPFFDTDTYSDQYYIKTERKAQ